MVDDEDVRAGAAFASDNPDKGVAKSKEEAVDASPRLETPDALSKAPLAGSLIIGGRQRQRSDQRYFETG